MAEYISKEAAVDAGYLSDWYISSVGNEPPVWTDAHIDELLNDFIVIPKDTQAADAQPIKKGHWYHNTSKYISELDAYFIQACCSCCGKYSDRVDSYSTIMSNETCSHCGAKMDGDVEGRCEE